MPRELPPISPESINGPFLQRLLGPAPQVILEIGANHGMHTQLFLRSFPTARIHAFEPDPRAIEAFRRQVSNRRVTLHELAIGASNGRAQFHVSSGLPPDATPQVKAEYPKGWDQSGSLRAPKTHKEKWPWCKFQRTISVEVRTLDTWSRKHEPGPIDFLWADTQGAEADLVSGGRETLARTRYFYTECFDDELSEGAPNLSALVDMLPNFEIVKRYESDVLLRNSALTSA
ncbi:MAG: 2-O-methyltransferase NoeI [Planctomycetota bacterium]